MTIYLVTHKAGVGPDLLLADDEDLTYETGKMITVFVDKPTRYDKLPIPLPTLWPDSILAPGHNNVVPVYENIEADPLVQIGWLLILREEKEVPEIAGGYIVRSAPVDDQQLIEVDTTLVQANKLNDTLVAKDVALGTCDIEDYAALEEAFKLPSGNLKQSQLGMHNIIAD